MNKAAIAIALLGALGSSAFAGEPQPLIGKKPAPAAAKKPNCGESYDLAPRHVSTPTADTEQVAKKVLSQLQVNAVVKAKLADVQYCWNRLPAAQRKLDATALLTLAIDATGEVETVDIGGQLPQDASRCIAVAAAKWQFPVADQAGEFEYAVALRAM
jgi:hypothetical protein